MRKYVKRQLLELINTMCEAIEIMTAFAGKNDMPQLVELLSEQQNAAVIVGNEIETSEGEGTEAVHLLELYCEALWQISQATDFSAMETGIEQLAQLLEQVQVELRKIPEQLEVVFLPYKASMWDCMESVWEAACADDSCYPTVMPIPYFDLNQGQITARHYEGDKFPQYVPIVDYRNLPLEELQPDMVFVHNPFDRNNLITSVLPQFYSDRLKAVAQRLIYIPYYVTGNEVYVTHRYLPSYENMDFIVTQSETMIKSYAENIPEEKFLPFGSPVADRIIKLEKEKPSIPDEWKPMLPNGQDFGGERTVMLNTSISMLLGERDRFLNKIEYIFDLVKEMKGILLIWRPHPLLYSTLENMGQKYVERMKSLEQRFLDEKLGVLDKTPDVGITVALCDAYLGEDASSLIHMFGITGKPRFYINTQIPPKNTAENEADYEIAGYCKAGEAEYILLDKLGWIIKKDSENSGWNPFLRIPDREYIRGRAYRSMEIKNESLWLYPENALGALVYDMQKGLMRKVFAQGDSVKDDSAQFDSSQEQIFEHLEEKLQLSKAAECVQTITAERFVAGRTYYEWYEGPSSRVEDYFDFLVSAEKGKIISDLGPYPTWVSFLDGSCGRKVLEAVKKSLYEES